MQGPRRMGVGSIFEEPPGVPTRFRPSEGRAGGWPARGSSSLRHPRGLMCTLKRYQRHFCGTEGSS
jgi:hypothetical protein